MKHQIAGFKLIAHFETAQGHVHGALSLVGAMRGEFKGIWSIHDDLYRRGEEIMDSTAFEDAILPGFFDAWQLGDGHAV